MVAAAKIAGAAAASLLGHNEMSITMPPGPRVVS